MSTIARGSIHADLVIVGGGSAGSLLAARLSEDPSRSVMLVEAGEEARDPAIWDPTAWPSLQGRAYDWDYRTEPQPGTAGRVHHWARGRLMGGSSCLHAMGYMRGHPDDFRGWAEATGDPGWSWEGLLPMFMANEDHSLGGDGIHGKGGPMPVHIPGDEVSPLARAFIDAGAAQGLPRLQGHNSGTMVGVTPNSLNIRNGRRVSAADAWLTPEIRGRKNLTILTGTLARRVLLEPNRVRSIELAGRNGSVEVTADLVVVSAGALESPALLMRSGIGPSEVLTPAGVRCQVDVPQIGRNLQDHLLGAGNLYAAARAVPRSRLQHSESMAYLRADGFEATGQPQIVVGCGIAPIVSERFNAPKPGAAYTLLFGITHPTSRGSVRISGPDPKDRLVIDPAYLQTDDDRKLFRRALAAAREIGHTAELAQWREQELLPGKLRNGAAIDDFIAQAVTTHHHPCGTCRMGKDTNAVVDSNLRLQALDNLFVVDASVMPSLTAGPIHAAVLAIAERFAQNMAAANKLSRTHQK